MLEIRGLSKKYGAHEAVRAMDLDIRAGEFFGILGPSGCGKTSLLRLLAGLEHADTGTIHLSGQRIDELPAYLRPVNTVFQSYALFPHFDVETNVGFALKMQKKTSTEIKNRVQEMLALVRMEPFAKRKVTMLSGGEQQRVALARALAGRPQVLLLDEPLSALDRKLRHEMQVELKGLQKKLNMTFIFVTHDQDEAMSLSDRMVVLQSGRIEQLGSPRHLYERPATDFVARFLGQMNAFSGHLDLQSAVPGIVHENQRLPISRDSKFCDESVLKHGAPATWMIRPENIRIKSKQEPQSNQNRGASDTLAQIPARLEQLIFKGPVVEIIVSLQARPELRWSVLEQAAGNGRRMPDSPLFPGDPLMLEFSLATLTIVPDGSGRIL